MVTKTETLHATNAEILRADRRVWRETDPLKARVLLRAAKRLRASRRGTLGYVELTSTGRVDTYPAP